MTEDTFDDLFEDVKGIKKKWELLQKKLENPCVYATVLQRSEPIKYDKILSELDHELKQAHEFFTSGELKKANRLCKQKIKIIRNKLIPKLEPGESYYFEILRFEILFRFYSGRSLAMLGDYIHLTFPRSHFLRYSNDLNLLEAKKKFEECLLYYDEVGGPWLEKIYTVILCELGQVYHRIGEWNLAKKAFLKTIEFDQNYTVPYHFLALISFFSKDYRACVKWCLGLLECKMDDDFFKKKALGNAAIAYLHLEDYDAATKLVKRLKGDYFEYLEKFKKDSDLLKFQNDPRFKKIMEILNG